MRRSISLVINKSEITAGTRGASLGPEAVMAVARNQGSTLFGDYPLYFIEDENYRLDKPIEHPFAKKIEGLVNIFDKVCQRVADELQNDKFPLVIAADHGSAGGTLAGLKKAFPNKRLGVIWIDAHGDLHTPYTTPSGNMHGMPLSTALGDDNLACKINDVPLETQLLWERLKSTGYDGPKVSPEDLVFIGARDLEAEEIALMKRLDIKNFPVDEVTLKGSQVILQEIEQKLKNCEMIYVSFDVDAMDPQMTSHGTGTPVDNGLTPLQAQELLVGLAKWEKTRCLEFVEINPCLDEKTNKMAEVAFELLEEVIQVL